MRKILLGGLYCSLLTFCCLQFFSGVSLAFSDVNRTDWFFKYLDELSEDGIVDTSKPLFYPSNSLNRAELTKMIVIATDLEDKNYQQDPYFKDVSASSWFFPYIQIAFEHGIITGYSDTDGISTGYFGPADNVNRAAAVKIIVNAFELDEDDIPVNKFTDVRSGDWFNSYISSAYYFSIIDGYSGGTFRPEKNLNRAEAVKIVSLAKAPKVRNIEDYDAVASSFDNEDEVEVDVVDVDPAEPKIDLPNDIGREIGIIDPVLSVERSDLALQGVGQPFIDPDFGSRLIRVSDAPANGMLRHEYSQLQAFNADNSHILLDNGSGFEIKNINSLQTVKKIPGDVNPPRWNPANKDEIVFFEDDTGIVEVKTYNFQTDDIRITGSLPAKYVSVEIEPSWEEFSRDGKWLAAVVNRSNGGQTIVTYNLTESKLYAEIDLDSLPETSCSKGANWVAPSPLGKYLIIQWSTQGKENCQGVEAREIKTGAYIGHISDHYQHSDLGITASGEEFYMTSYMKNSLLLGYTTLPGSVNFNSGYDQLVADPGWYHVDHISCQGPAGVCVVDGSGDGNDPFTGEIYLVYLDGYAESFKNDQAKIRRLTFHRSSNSSYYAQPHPSFSRNGNFVIFASDWGSSANGIDDYLIDLRGVNIASP